MAMSERRADDETPPLSRTLCVICRQPILWVIVRGQLAIVDGMEWEPRAACQSCLHTRRAHPGRPVSCGRCHNTGYVGQKRPKGRMVAIDMAWGDEFHLRIVGPRTDRRTGEALHSFHVCSASQPQSQEKAA